MRKVLAMVISGMMLWGCATIKNYNPGNKFVPDQLQEDYKVFRETMDESHPSLYWYTPKDSIDY